MYFEIFLDVELKTVPATFCCTFDIDADLHFLCRV